MIDVDATRTLWRGGSGVTIGEATIAAAWNIQGDPARASFVDAARRVFERRAADLAEHDRGNGALTAIWLGPRSWLLASGGDSGLVDFVAQRDAINAAGGALFDVSASRVAWTLPGRARPPF